MINWSPGAWLVRIAVVAVAVGLAVASSGCRSTPTAEVAAAPDVARMLERRVVPDRAALLDDNPLLVDSVVPEAAPGVQESSALPSRPAVAQPSVAVAEYPDKLIKGILDPDEKVKVFLNLDAASLNEIVPLFGALLNFSYLIDPAVKGAVTMTVDTEMTAREAWEMFEHILWLSGAYASKNPGFIHVLPFAKMPRERRLGAVHDPQANVEVAFIPVFNTKSAEVMGHLRAFMTEGATITDLVPTNTLLIVEAPANMAKLRELVERLDVKGEAEWPHICLRCREVDVAQVLEDLQTILPVLGYSVTNKGPSGGQIKLVALPRLQVIVASAALKEVLDEVERWIRVLDRSDKTERENIFFYNVRHGAAAQLSEALGVFFNTSTTRGTPVSSTRSTAAKATAPGRTPEAAATAAPTATRSRTDTAPGDATIFDTPVVVYVDDVNNRLTIRTTNRAYALVRALLERQDVPPRQVMIEAVIAEIRLTESTQFGFSYAAQQMAGSVALDMVMANTGSIPTVDSTADGVADGIIQGVAEGIGFRFKEKGKSLGFLTAVAGAGNVSILSAPQIMAASDQEAVINVGAKVPIITGEYTGDTVSSRRNYQYYDTGTILTVTPHITAGNEVRLDVKQEVSAAVKTETGVTESPTILNKQLQTTLVIPDGGTIMMGGLIGTEHNDSHTGVPLLKDIPVLGKLFRSTLRTANRTEILVLITVQVIDRASGTDSLLERYQASVQEIRERLGTP